MTILTTVARKGRRYNDFVILTAVAYKGRRYILTGRGTKDGEVRQVGKWANRQIGNSAIQQFGKSLGWETIGGLLS